MHPFPVREEVLYVLLPVPKYEIHAVLSGLLTDKRIRYIAGPREGEEGRIGEAVIRWELVCPLEKLAYL
jgi:hypothetical protein